MRFLYFKGVKCVSNRSMFHRFFQFYGGDQLDNNFSFRIRYKFLSNETAKSRYRRNKYYSFPLATPLKLG